MDSNRAKTKRSSKTTNDAASGPRHVVDLKDPRNYVKDRPVRGTRNNTPVYTFSDSESDKWEDSMSDDPAMTSDEAVAQVEKKGQKQAFEAVESPSSVSSGLAEEPADEGPPVVNKVFLKFLEGILGQPGTDDRWKKELTRLLELPSCQGQPSSQKPDVSCWLENPQFVEILMQLYRDDISSEESNSTSHVEGEEDNNMEED